jgi:hypothetical protein
MYAVDMTHTTKGIRLSGLMISSVDTSRSTTTPITLGNRTYPRAREKVLGGIDARSVCHGINRQRTCCDGGTNVFGGQTWARNLELHDVTHQPTHMQNTHAVS